MRSDSIKKEIAKNKLEGQQRMDEYHQPSIDLLEKVLEPFKNIKKDRALDLACGIGKLTKDFLSKRFNNVDLVDLDAEDIEKARQLKLIIPQIDRVEHEAMQDFTANE